MPHQIFEEIFDKKKVRVLRLFLSQPDTSFYLQEVSIQSITPPATCFRILQTLIRAGVVEETKISRLKIYKLAKSEKVDMLKKLLAEPPKPLEIFKQALSKLPHVEEAILHGKKSDSKANILIIGDHLDTSKVDELVIEMKEKYKYVISHLIISKQQYKQMSQIGLYPGEKEVLFQNQV